MKYHATVPALYREDVTTPDIVDRSTLADSTTETGTGGALPDGTYKVALVPRGQITNTISRQGLSGRGLPALLDDVVTSGANNSILITPTEPGDYDVYVSVDDDPLWVATVYNFEWSTTGVRTTGAAQGATATSGAVVAGKIKITVPGDGLAASAHAVESTEYVYPPTNGVNLESGATEINASGFEYIDFLIFFEWFGETEAPELVVVPILKSQVQVTGVDGLVDRYYSETPYQIDVLGGREDDNFSPNFHRLRVATHGAQSVSLVIAKIEGRFARANIHYLLN